MKRVFGKFFAFKYPGDVFYLGVSVLIIVAGSCLLWGAAQRYELFFEQVGFTAVGIGVLILILIVWKIFIDVYLKLLEATLLVLKFIAAAFRRLFDAIFRLLERVVAKKLMPRPSNLRLTHLFVSPNLPHQVFAQYPILLK